MSGHRHYRAFISYSHADRKVAQWLHRALETYRIPARLVGQETAIGPVPSRLAPIFRDRDELSAAGHLSDALRQALEASDFLIVIASPAAAQSQWVNEEIRLFKAMKGEARVLALIADGNPGERGSAGAFPPALRFHVSPDGAITDDEAEPIAADIRPGKDGRRLAKLKLAAGLSGLPLDALVQREAARRQRWLAGIAAASLALVAIMAVLTVLAIQGQREAERQRAQAEGLIEFMLTDLRARLEPVGRLDVLDTVGQRALSYYEGQRLAQLDADALGRRARAMMLVGEVRDLNGDSTAAFEAYAAAERATAELLARDPANPDRMFDHAQSIFYVGQLAWQRRDYATAEQHFRRYVALADAMLATDPDNPKWLAEVGYAANSLGAAYNSQRKPAEAIAQFRRYAAVTDQLSAAAPTDRAARWDASQARAWLADAHLLAGDLAAAEAERLAEAAILDALSQEDPRDSNVRMSQARNRDAQATLALAAGDLAAAQRHATAALDTIRPLLAQDPGNSLWQEIAAGAGNSLAESMLLAGRFEQADAANRQARAALPAIGADRAIQFEARATSIEIALLFQSGRRAEARDAVARFQARFGATPEQPEIADTIAMLSVQLMEASDLLAQGDRAAARQRAQAALALPITAPSPRHNALLAQLTAIAEGRPPRPAPGGYPAHRLVTIVR